MEQPPSEALIAAGRGYEALFVPALFSAWTHHVLNAGRVCEGAHVLDVACGTGVLARDALARAGNHGRVVGVDPAPGMLAVAGEIEPRIDWLPGNAESLAIADGAFDCVVSQFGMMFFTARQEATREMHRVLKPGGSLALAVWRSVTYNPAYADVIAVLDEEVGAAAADALRVPFNLGDAGAVTALLDKSGFTDVAVEAKTETARFPSSRQMVEAELRGWLPLFDINLSEDTITRVLARSDRTLGKYTGEGGEATFPMSAHIFSGRKP